MSRAARQAIAWAREGGHGWTEDAKTAAAVAHMVAQIGEAARRISTRTKAHHAEVPWAEIAGMRNRVYHEYGALDVRVLAATISRDLPQLRKGLDAILAKR